MKKTETKTLERTYTIPLRKEYLKVPRQKRTKKAVTAVKQFLQKHMKSKQVKLGKNLNEELWKHGIRNPPHHIKITTVKDEEGLVKAELFGHKIETQEKEKKSKFKKIAEKVGVGKNKEIKSKTPEEKKEKTLEQKPEVKEEKPKEKIEIPQTTEEKTKENVKPTEIKKETPSKK